MNENNKITHNKKRFALRSVDGFLYHLHVNRSGSNKFLTIGISFVLYVTIIYIFGNLLGVSANYFVVIPLIAITFSFGFFGGVVSGVLALPLNLLMFFLIEHPEYAPESKIIAEFTGITIGTVLGYLSDYYYEIGVEIERRRIAEEKLQQSIEEKEILIHEIHHRVKNNLNIVKSLIQLQLNRSENPQFSKEGEKLITRIYSIARVHEQLYKGNKATAPALDEYLPQLVQDILSGLEDDNIEIEYHMEIRNVEVSIQQATSLGLIINEVITNAIKYSLALVESPKLEVVLRAEPGKKIIELINNAPTFIPRGDDYQGLGLKLIKTLSAQIDAEYEYLPGNGTTFRLSLPDVRDGDSVSL